MNRDGGGGGGGGGGSVSAVSWRVGETVEHYWRGQWYIVSVADVQREGITLEPIDYSLHPRMMVQFSDIGAKSFDDGLFGVLGANQHSSIWSSSYKKFWWDLDLPTGPSAEATHKDKYDSDPIQIPPAKKIKSENGDAKMRMWPSHSDIDNLQDDRRTAVDTTL